MVDPVLRVLLVDDDRDDYLLTRDLFTQMNGRRYELAWEPDYDAALAAMCSGTFDVYLVDYRLGQRDGLELLRAAIAGRCSGPAIILTGQSDRAIDLAAMQAGAADYLDKGRLDAALLERSIRYALEHKRHQDELQQRIQDATAELAQANDALTKADRRKDEFLAMLAHELRGPLAPMRNGLEIMKRTDDAAQMQRARDTMERQLGQLVRLVDDLLEVSRVTIGKLALRRQRVELADVVRQAVESASPLIERFEHLLELALPAAPVWLHADPARLAQVFGNLLNNACKYTEPKGHIRLGAVREGGDVVVSVSDSGVGIASDQLESVFGMFTQVDASLERAQGGLGIGLTLVNDLVLLHGGSVHAFSPGLGQGSEFVVRLPVLAEAAPAAAQPLHAAQPAPPQQAAGVPLRRVLIVDDNADSLESMAMLLDLPGYETHTAGDGAIALQVAEHVRPDVVLLDIGLPGLNGYEVCRRLRGQAWGASALLIALTGWGQEDDRRKSSDAGFDVHLVKPVEYATLMDVLDSALGKAGGGPP